MGPIFYNRCYIVKRIIISSIVLVEVVSITALTIFIYRISRIPAILQNVGTRRSLAEEGVMSEPSDGLQFFFEPIPGRKRRSIDAFGAEGIASINNDSLNDLQNYSVKKPKDTFRIVTLGDSWTYGLFVDTQQNWPDQIENMFSENPLCKTYPNTEVINTAVDGYDLAYEVERFIRRGAKYKPNLVLWDIADMYRVDEKLLPLEYKYMNDFRKNYAEDNQGYTFIVALGWWRKAEAISIEQMGRKNVENYQLHELNKLRSLYKGNILIINDPKSLTSSQTRILRTFVHSHQNTYHYDSMKSIVGTHYVFPVDGHPTPEGHKKIAKAIFNYLQNHKNLFCP